MKGWRQRKVDPGRNPLHAHMGTNPILGHKEMDMTLESTARRDSRIAGLWYLAIAVFYTFGMIYADSALYVPGNPEETIARIRESGTLVRLGFVSCLAGHVCFIVLANALYRLYEPVDRGLARLMVLFILAGVSVAFLNRVHQIVPVILLEGAGDYSAFSLGQLTALVAALLELHAQGERMAAVFWGLWLLPLGILVLKSRRAPGVLGVLLLAACGCYLVDFAAPLFFPGILARIDVPFSIIETLAEVSFLLWLLVQGPLVLKGRTRAAGGVACRPES